MDISLAQWRKSARSGGTGGDCVEVAVLDNATISHKAGDTLIAVRDSKDPKGPVLFFTPGEWRALTGGVRDGEF